MKSYEYIQFVDEKAVLYMPQPNYRVGDKINFKCPFCGDSKKLESKRRGFFYLRTGSYYCFNCGISLSGIKFIEALSGSDYHEIRREYVKLFLKSGLSGQLSSYSEKPESEPGLFGFKDALKSEWRNPLTKDAMSYLEGRGLFKTPFLKDPLYSVFNKAKDREYILIPWRINGVDAYYQINDFKKFGPVKYIFPKNSRKLVYGIDNVDPTYGKIFVFEGVYDSLFVKNGVAVGTKSITDYQLNLIRARWPNHQICLSFDNDKPGIRSSVKYVENDGDFRFFKWFNVNTKQKDVNEYVLARNDFGSFTDPKVLDRLVFDKLQMKMYFLENGQWERPEKQKYDKKRVSPGNRFRINI